MSGHPPEEREDELRRLIAADTRTSRAHDDAVLAAARGIAHGRPRRLRRIAPYAIAASVVLGVTVFLYQPVEDDTLRSSNQGLERLVTPASGSTLVSAPAELRWPAQSGASSYRVTLRDAAANVVWNSAAVTEPRVLLRTPTPLTPQTYYWSVEVEGAADSRSLGSFWFRLSR
jgi:hypothetical protein